MERDLESIQKDQAKYGDIPQDVKEAIGLVPDSSRFVSDEPKVILWGSGTAYREFLHVDDMASACIFLMEKDSFCSRPGCSNDSMKSSFLNIGTGVDLTINDTALLVQKTVGFQGETIFNADQPDGTPKKLLDTSLISKLGWEPRFSLLEGLADSYDWYLCG
jgi:GDP-L-fucose synthase